MAVLTLVAASALTPSVDAKRVRSATERGQADFGDAQCGSTAVASVAISPRPFRLVVERPAVGDPVRDTIEGWIIGRVTAIDREPVDGGTLVNISAEFDAECLVDPPFITGRPYTISYSWRLPKRAFDGCGQVPMFWTMATVEANGYTRCTRARRLARWWRRHQDRHCHYGFCESVRHGRFRCEFRSEITVAAVDCQRGRARVTWSWGD
ncbi:MAG TPA: hypothetical protein VEX36_10850 [Thermoleophilaceae bacterium]|nr:hypothetical protein [Thermoleophilaceae bacterium]